MRSFVISICILILIAVYIFVTSSYFLHTEHHIISVLDDINIFDNASDSSNDATSTEKADELCGYMESRNKILSLYINHSKCTELTLLLKEMSMHLKSGNTMLCRFAAINLLEVLRDIRENELLTLNGIM